MRSNNGNARFSLRWEPMWTGNSKRPRGLGWGGLSIGVMEASPDSP